MSRTRRATPTCDAGRVSVNGKIVKASQEVKIGDVIEIKFGAKIINVRVTDLSVTTKKDEAKELFEYL